MIAERSREDAERGQGKKLHVMSSFFYPKILQTGYTGVRRWTRKVSLALNNEVHVQASVSVLKLSA